MKTVFTCPLSLAYVTCSPCLFVGLFHCCPPTLLFDITLTSLPSDEFPVPSLPSLISHHWANHPEVLVLAAYHALFYVSSSYIKWGIQSWNRYSPCQVIVQIFVCNTSFKTQYRFTPTSTSARPKQLRQRAQLQSIVVTTPLSICGWFHICTDVKE